MKTYTDEEVDVMASIPQGEMVHDNHGQMVIYLGMFLWNDGKYRSEPDPEYKDV